MALIHIPLHLYPFFVQPILQLLFPSDGRPQEYNDRYSDWASRHEFLNISVTPIEASIVCERELANRYFVPLVESFNRACDKGQERVFVSDDDFVVVQVDGQGLNASQRVLELTSPLAFAGM